MFTSFVLSVTDMLAFLQSENLIIDLVSIVLLILVELDAVLVLRHVFTVGEFTVITKLHLCLTLMLLVVKWLKVCFTNTGVRNQF